MTSEPLSVAGMKGLRQYLEGPLLFQLAQENPEAIPSDVTFVFGHTHKPFELRVGGYAGFDGPVDVYNTGGWVVDTLKPDTRAGAAAVLIDEELNVASLRLYNQRTFGSSQVAVRVASDSSDNPLAERLGSRIDPQVDPWARLSAVVAEAVPERYACLRTIIDQGVAAAKARPAPKRQPA